MTVRVACDRVRAETKAYIDATRRSAEADFGIEALARRAGLTKTTLVAMRRQGKRRFRIRTVRALADVLRVDVRDLIHPDESPPPAAPTAPHGNIESPKPGAVFRSGQIEVTGAIGDVPKDHAAWLVVSKHGLHWPKEPGIVTPRETESYRTFIVHADPEGGEFDLSLWLLPPRGDSAVRAWLQRGRETGSYPGLRLEAFVGIHVLAGIHGLRLDA